MPTMPMYELEGRRPACPRNSEFWLAPNAAVIGSVDLSSGVSIWFGATIRGDNENIRIGEATNVQDGVTIHSDPGSPCTIGRHCTIGHNAIVHGCEIGDGCLIGMGATVLNDVVLGENCLVGANALLTEGSVFPAGSLIVGSPGRIVRELDTTTKYNLIKTADKYVLNARRFSEHLKEIHLELDRDC